MKVLHVDDEMDLREITQLSLELDPDIEVDSAESAAHALALIGTSQPNIILLDVMMPDMDGPNLLRVLRDRPDTKDIPVVFMTATAQMHMIDALMSLGVVGIISKPFDPMSLAGELNDLMRAARIH